ncbi:DUF3106 domain-containing protein [Variovorax sp. J22R193]|uniref:DUF3106 domain-containing protein n=1 Tax=Variovorax fucosicus TaxID=3053517 RepID=UPI002577C4FB|nr:MULTISPECIES: DUF3106 domain-containing protein [unclassified Variovorax]MDM0041469.1 DUF3106 domain-containing protein [Variovorax sp. J22R193]
MPARPLSGAAGLLIAAIFCLQALPAAAQPGAATPPSTPASAPPTAKVTVSKPLWATLTAEQQAALKPLAPHWNSISEPHKRKWLALSRNYDSMKPEDQVTLHSRMTEWAGLSAQERALARLNFAEVKRLPVDERKAKWEAYQALSEEERRKLAASASVRPASAALPIRPVPARKLAPVPAIPTASAKGEHTPRIQLAPPVAPVAPVAAAPVPATTPVVTSTPAPGAPAVAPVTMPPVPAESQVPAPAAVPAARPTE